MRRSLIPACIVLFAPIVFGALPVSDWQFQQSMAVAAPGLVRFDLQAETFNAARSGLYDLRIVDPAGAEVPYLVEQPRPRSESVANAKEFHVELGFKQTTVHITTGTDAPLTGITLSVPPGPRFTKAVRIEGSPDENEWQVLTDGAPIFRSDGAATNLRVPFPESRWQFLRVLIDDSRSEPLPITGAEIIRSGSQAPAEPMQISVRSREENSGTTRIALDLGSANLFVAALAIDTKEALFTRHITVASPALSDGRLQEQTITTAVVYRVEANGAITARLDLPIEKQIQGRELILLIENGEKSPLAVNSITGTRRITRLLFSASAPGTYTLLVGNEQCAPPHYNIDDLREQKQGSEAMHVPISPITANPSYRAQPESVLGAKIDLAGWKFRKPLRIGHEGAHQIDLDTDVLAQAASDLRDVRIVRDERQVPFVTESTSSLHGVSLASSESEDRRRPTVSRWSLKLPRARLPIARIACDSRTPGFERSLRLSEQVNDDRGEKYVRELGRVSWRRQPAQLAAELSLALKTAPQSDTLVLETDNGDNQSIELHDFRGRYPVTYLLFNAPAGQSLWLYYGNEDAVAPHYDLSLIAEQLVRAERTAVIPGTEEKLKVTRVGETLTGSARYVFWGVLALVVLALLFLISRLLPKTND